jgi:hypothetical protein
LKEGHKPDHCQSPHKDLASSLSLHRWNAAEDETGMTEICMMSSAVEMHVAKLKTGIKSASALNKSSVKKVTMTTTVLIMTNLTDSILPKGGCNAGGVKVFSHDLKRVCWPLNFKLSGIEKYDGSTNPA